jgi:hypothetical protein
MVELRISPKRLGDMRTIILGTAIGIVLGFGIPLAGSAGASSDGCQGFTWPYYPPECLTPAERASIDVSPVRSAFASPQPEQQSRGGHLEPLMQMDPVAPRVKEPRFEDPMYFDVVPQTSPSVTVWRAGNPTTYIFEGG